MGLPCAKQRFRGHHLRSSDNPSPNAKYACGRLEEASLAYCEDLFVFDLEKRALISRKQWREFRIIPAQQQPSGASRQYTNTTPINCRGVETINKEGNRKQKWSRVEVHKDPPVKATATEVKEIQRKAKAFEESALQQGPTLNHANY